MKRDRFLALSKSSRVLARSRKAQAMARLAQDLVRAAKGAAVAGADDVGKATRMARLTVRATPRISKRGFLGQFRQKAGQTCDRGEDMVRYRCQVLMFASACQNAD